MSARSQRGFQRQGNVSRAMGVDDPRHRRSMQALASALVLGEKSGLRFNDQGGLELDIDKAGPLAIGNQGVTVRVSGALELVQNSPTSITINPDTLAASGVSKQLAARASAARGGMEARIAALEATVAAQAATIAGLSARLPPV